MKLRNITPVAAAVALAIGSMGMSSEANAGVSGSIGASNFYLWRGVDASGGAAQVYGELKYSHDSGAYAAAWLSSHADGNENNYYAGYGMKAGSIDLDFSLWDVTYPTKSFSKNETIYNDNVEEFVASASIMGISGSLVFDIDPDNKDKYKYLSLGYGKDKYSVLVGKWFGDKDKGMMTFAHVTASYAISDELSFSLNKAFGEDGSGVNKELLANIAYTKGFEVK